MSGRIPGNKILVFLLTVASWTANASAWGRDGHRIINQSFTSHFPVNTLSISRFTQYYADHASDADSRKSLDPSEDTRHFIDIDYYGEFGSGWFPHDFDSLVAEYGLSTVDAKGVLPWAIKSDYDSLVGFLHAGDSVNANRVIADLGHYIGDACQPLHCTVNYNRNGIHSPYESTMIKDYLSDISIDPDTARYVTDVLDYAFRIISESNSKIGAIFSADDQAGGQTARSSSPSTYYQTLWSLLDTLTVGQLQRASVALASVVYSAWVDAGLTRAPASIPLGFEVSELFPNPFNPASRFIVTLPLDVRPTAARVTVFDPEGRTVTAYATQLSGGRNLLTLDLSRFPSGVYFARVEVADGRNRHAKLLKAVLIK